MSNPDQPRPPDALLLLTRSCPFCPTVLAALAELVKEGRLGRVEVVNIEAHPEVAHALGARSVPWVKLGPFELEGLRSRAELERWVARAGTPQGMHDYFNELLASGALPKVLALVKRDDRLLETLLPLLADPQTELPVRVGITAIFEDFQGSAALHRLVPALGELARRGGEPRQRADAAHLLALTQSAEAIEYLQALLQDPEPMVREIAAESLAALEQTAGPGESTR